MWGCADLVTCKLGADGGEGTSEAQWSRHSPLVNSSVLRREELGMSKDLRETGVVSEWRAYRERNRKS